MATGVCGNRGDTRVRLCATGKPAVTCVWVHVCERGDRDNTRVRDGGTMATRGVNRRVRDGGADSPGWVAMATGVWDAGRHGNRRVREPQRHRHEGVYNHGNHGNRRVMNA